MKITMKVMATIMLSVAVVCAAGCKKDIAQGDGIFNGHPYVDLDLPSGLMWATCNVGANSPEEYGDYFAWGDTIPKDYYAWNTYKYSNGGYSQLTKYCFDSSYGHNGFTDNLTTLLPEDDAATANWGNGWCTPTKYQWQELIDNTTSTWMTQNGVYGRLFTASNGNSLFLPATAYQDQDILNGAGFSGFYWSSSLDTDGPGKAWIFYYDRRENRVSIFYRCCGLSVRAVHKN